MIGEGDKSIKLSIEEKKKIKLKKELNSFKNKFHGLNLIWFDCLADRKKFMLLKDWKRYKWNRRNNKNDVKYFKTWDYSSNKIEWIKTINYKASFKHFINEKKKMRYYKVKTQDFRNKTLENLLK